MKVLDHTVKHDGVIYPAETPVSELPEGLAESLNPHTIVEASGQSLAEMDIPDWVTEFAAETSASDLKDQLEENGLAKSGSKIAMAVRLYEAGALEESDAEDDEE
jgi:hypothetical protein